MIAYHQKINLEYPCTRFQYIQDLQPDIMPPDTEYSTDITVDFDQEIMVNGIQSNNFELRITQHQIADQFFTAFASQLEPHITRHWPNLTFLYDNSREDKTNSTESRIVIEFDRYVFVNNERCFQLDLTIVGSWELSEFLRGMQDLQAVRWATAVDNNEITHDI